jgi:hypothetical protein
MRNTIGGNIADSHENNCQLSIKKECLIVHQASLFSVKMAFCV